MIYNIQTENIFKWNNIIKKFSFYGKTVQELLDKINELQNNIEELRDINQSLRGKDKMKEDFIANRIRYNGICWSSNNFFTILNEK